MPEHKCSKCGLGESNGVRFHKDKRSPNGLTSQCANCRNHKTRQWQTENLFAVITDRVNQCANRRKRGIGKLTENDIKSIMCAYDICAYCGCSYTASNPMTFDHILAIANGGLNTRDNVVCCCMTCNARKNDSSLETFIARYGLAESCALTA